MKIDIEKTFFIQIFHWFSLANSQHLKILILFSLRIYFTQTESNLHLPMSQYEPGCSYWIPQSIVLVQYYSLTCLLMMC